MDLLLRPREHPKEVDRRTAPTGPSRSRKVDVEIRPNRKTLTGAFSIWTALIILVSKKVDHDDSSLAKPCRTPAPKAFKRTISLTMGSGSMDFIFKLSVRPVQTVTELKGASSYHRRFSGGSDSLRVTSPVQWLRAIRGSGEEELF
jgi:hypothetical protein